MAFDNWPRYRCRSCGADFDRPAAGGCPDCGSAELVDHAPVVEAQAPDPGVGVRDDNGNLIDLQEERDPST